jgi:hypothetical protein
MKLSPTYSQPSSQATDWAHCAGMGLDAGGSQFTFDIRETKAQPSVTSYVTILAGLEPRNNSTKEAGR